MGTSSQAALEALEVQLGGANLNSDTYLVLGPAHGVSHQDHKNQKVPTPSRHYLARPMLGALLSVRAPED